MSESQPQSGATNTARPTLPKARSTPTPATAHSHSTATTQTTTPTQPAVFDRIHSTESDLSHASTAQSTASSTADPSGSDDAAQQTRTKRPYPHVRAKRRRVSDIETSDQWRCPNAGCTRAFKRTSSSSIKQHQHSCMYAVQNAMYHNPLLPIRTLSAPYVSNATVLQQANILQQQLSQQQQQPLLAHSIPHPASHAVSALYNQPFTNSQQYYETLRSSRIVDQLSYLPTSVGAAQRSASTVPQMSVLSNPLSQLFNNHLSYPQLHLTSSAALSTAVKHGSGEYTPPHVPVYSPNVMMQQPLNPYQSTMVQSSTATSTVPSKPPSNNQ